MRAVFLTAERLKMHTWRRKKRLKFLKRWRAQHGENFRWFILEPHYAIKPLGEDYGRMIFFKRGPNTEPKEPCPLESHPHQKMKIPS